MDRPPHGPGLSAQHLKTDFSQDFQRNPFTKKIATHLNAMHANS
jgi:hypothetical protein